MPDTLPVPDSCPQCRSVLITWTGGSPPRGFDRWQCGEGHEFETPPARGKLVRDRIPEIIRSTGEEPLTRIAGAAEYPSLLRDKLSEEVGEFLGSGDPEELADVLEVVFALAAGAGIGPGELERLRAAKAAERGGFMRRMVWLGNAGGQRVAEPADSTEGESNA